MRIGMTRHRTSGHTVSSEHFTGLTGSKGTPRKQKLSVKQKRMKHGSHVNKYA